MEVVGPTSWIRIRPTIIDGSAYREECIQFFLQFVLWWRHAWMSCFTSHIWSRGIHFKRNLSQTTYRWKRARYRCEMDPEGPLDIMVRVYILQKREIKVGDEVA